MNCARTVNDGKDRCPWEGEPEDYAEHAQTTGHWPCAVCRRSLRDDETQTCGRCINAVALDFQRIESAYAELPAIVEESGYRMSRLPGGDALVMLSDGSMASPQTPNQYTQPREAKPTVHVEHPEMGRGVTTTGDPVEHVAYLEQRIPSDGREHVRDHWTADPTSVLAELEAAERDWRHTFGHPPAEDLATVAGCLDYLRQWLYVAAKTHPGFDEFATEIRVLRSRLEHVAGLADDPRRDPIPCGCGGKLVQDYTGDALSKADERGLSDDRRCRECGTVYKPDEYAFHLRLLTDTPGWVSVDQASRLIDRPAVTVKAWVARLDLPAVCNRLTKRLLVDAERARELAEERPARKRAG